MEANIFSLRVVVFNNPRFAAFFTKDSQASNDRNAEIYVHFTKPFLIIWLIYHIIRATTIWRFYANN